MARKVGRGLMLRPDWSTYKFTVMRELLGQKFQIDTFAKTLLRTKSATLVEGNWWGDQIWGQCPVGQGENRLGRMLMEIREELR
jgi:predicted NAD-dependent protein-ADP-ribosyltransferase YbiA (DUF1768 family)